MTQPEPAGAGDPHFIAAFCAEPIDFSDSLRKVDHSRAVIRPKASSLTMLLSRSRGQPVSTRSRKHAGSRRHHADAVGQHRGLIQRMGDQQHRRAGLAPELEQFVAHQQSRLLVERAEGLVEQQQPRTGDERAGDAQPLAHAAGQLRRIGPGKAGQSHERRARGRRARGSPCRPCRRGAGRTRRCRRRSARESWHPPGRRCRRRRARRRHRRSSNITDPWSGGGEPAEHIEQGRLAAAGGAHHREELALVQVEIDRAERMHRLAAGACRIDPGDAAQARMRCGGAWRRMPRAARDARRSCAERGACEPGRHFLLRRSAGRKLSSITFFQSNGPSGIALTSCRPLSMTSMPS